MAGREQFFLLNPLMTWLTLCFLTYNIKIEVHTQENVHTQLQYKIKYNEIMVKPLLRGHLTLPKWNGHLIWRFTLTAG